VDGFAGAIRAEPSAEKHLRKISVVDQNPFRIKDFFFRDPTSIRYGIAMRSDQQVLSWRRLSTPELIVWQQF
jgi:hypothetical protein